MGMHPLAAAMLEEPHLTIDDTRPRWRLDDPPPCECGCPSRMTCSSFCPAFRRWVKTGRLQAPAEVPIVRGELQRVAAENSESAAG